MRLLAHWAHLPGKKDKTCRRDTFCGYMCDWLRMMSIFSNNHQGTKIPKLLVPCC